MIDIVIVINHETASSAKKEGYRTELMRLVARHIGLDTRMMTWGETGLYNLDGSSASLWKAYLEKDKLNIVYRGPVSDVETQALEGLQVFLQWRLG